MAEQNNSNAKNRPRLRTLEAAEGERHASWLELFFDLVFVLAVAQTARILAEHSDLGGAIKYFALFVPVWWSWVGFTFYADRFESDETTYRVLMFAGMLLVAALSLTLENAVSIQGDAPFVFCYVLVRAVIIALYARSAFYIPLARALCFRYIGGFGIAIGIWLVSLLLPPPLRYWLWAVAIITELVTPIVNNPNIRAIPFDLSHIPERFGLFTIIVLGEAVIATANGAATVEWNFSTIATATLGFAMAACIWWINFDFVEDGAVRSKSLIPRHVYIYGHFFIVAAIVALGIGVEHSIKESADAHLHFPTLALLSGGIACYIAATTLIRFVAGVCRLLYARLAAIVIALSVIYAGEFLPPLAVIVVLLFILSAGVWFESIYVLDSSGEESNANLKPCEHAVEMRVFEPRSEDGCEECVKNNYKWVHLRLCLECGHVGCCDSSRYKHAAKHFEETGHPVMASLESGENWAWCYIDERFVPAAPVE